MDEALDGTVEVAAGTPERQLVVEVPWQEGLTARQAVDRAGILAAFPDIDQAAPILGRFGTRIEGHAPLQPGDRVDVCRPLPRDPRQMRRELLAAGTVMGRAKPPPA